MTARHYSLLVVVGCHCFRSWVELEPQVLAHSMAIAFRCTNGDFYVALGSSMGLAFLVWIGGGLLKRVFTFLVNEPSLGQKSPILLLPRPLLRDFGSFFFSIFFFPIKPYHHCIRLEVYFNCHLSKYFKHKYTGITS